MSVIAENSTSSLTNDDLRIACVYAISGTYGLLPRLLYYITLALAIFGRNQPWLVLGALVSALTYAGCAAVHVMALVKSKKDVFDLDILGAWAILSTGAISYIGMIHWSSTLQHSRVRIIMIAWGTLIGIGLIFGRIGIYDQPLSDFEQPCYSSTGKLLTSTIQLVDQDFRCTYNCFNISKPMRATSEILAVPSTVLQNKWSKLGLVLIGPAMFAAYTAISYDSIRYGLPQLCIELAFHYMNVDRGNLPRTIYSTSQKTMYGGYFALLNFIWQSAWGWRKVLMMTITLPWITLCYIMDILCIPFLILNIVLNELHLNLSGLPENESIYSVGQWSPWVNSGLVVIAAIINKCIEKFEEAKLKKRHAESADETGPLQSEIAFNNDGIDTDVEHEHQMVGVVKPKLAHVQTLRDGREFLGG